MDRTFCDPKWMLKQAMADLSMSRLLGEIEFRLDQSGPWGSYKQAKKDAEKYAAKYASRLVWC